MSVPFKLMLELVRRRGKSRPYLNLSAFKENLNHSNLRSPLFAMNFKSENSILADPSLNNFCRIF